MDNDLDMAMGDFTGEKDLETGISSSIIHLRVQQRTGRKNITIIEGIPEEFDLKKMLRAWKKNLNCNGSITEDKDGNTVVQLTGDQRQEISKFLVAEGITLKECIKIHGA